MIARLNLDPINNNEVSILFTFGLDAYLATEGKRSPRFEHEGFTFDSDRLRCCLPHVDVECNLLNGEVFWFLHIELPVVFLLCCCKY